MVLISCIDIKILVKDIFIIFVIKNNLLFFDNLLGKYIFVSLIEIYDFFLIISICKVEYIDFNCIINVLI